ncbi:MAG: tetratricopeptide repeat protein [Desulfobacterales bacterium]|nr:tetratricopeptide repeat protein [Desulfobacterales bacterium]
MSRKKKKKKQKPLGNNISAKGNTDINKELRKALQYHRSGQLQKAEQTYTNILEIRPDHADSLHGLGVIACQAENYDAGIDLFKKAVQIKPDFADAFYNMGGVLSIQGKSEQAVACWQKTVEIKPDHADAHYNLGKTLHKLGKPGEAAVFFRKAKEIRPEFEKAYQNIMTVLNSQTEDRMATALRYHQSGELQKAEEIYKNILEINPEHADSLHLLGVAASQAGRFSEAVTLISKAIQINNNKSIYYNNIGNALKELDMPDKAVENYRRALDINSGYAEAYYNMGVSLKELGRTEQALSCCQSALQINPDYAEVHNNMGLLLEEQGNTGKAVSCYRKALELNPDMGRTYSHLIHLLRKTCAWKELESLTEKLDNLTEKALRNGTEPAEIPFVSLTRYDDPSRNLKVAKLRASEISRSASKLNLCFSHKPDLPRKAKIRVGYLSNDFCNHPVAHLILGMFAHHKTARDEFEIYCYTWKKNDGNYYRERIQKDCDKFADLSDLNIAESAKRIYEDGIDILVDMMGHTKGTKTRICALRPAPVQVSYLGFPGTTGSDFLDYIITDRIITPEEHAPFYSEKFVYMPHCYQVNNNTQAISDKNWKKSDFGLPENSFVFCSFNQTYKTEPVIFDMWMKILTKVPGSVLWLLRKDKTSEKNLKHEADKRGINSKRLVFADILPLDEHLARLKLADLVLDTRIYNGGATTSNALWAGVPVVTVQGGHYVSRMSSSLLTAIGLPEMITHSPEEYENLCVRLADSPDELQAVRQKLADNRLTKPLFDTPRFARNLEKAYKEMWEIFLAGEKPRQIDVVEVGSGK